MALPRAMPTKLHLLKYIHYYRYWSQSKIKRISWTLSNHVWHIKWALIVYAFTVKSIVSLNIPHINLIQIISKQWMWQFLHHIKGQLGNLYHAYYRMLQIFLFITTFYCWFHSPFFYNSFSKDMFHYHCNFLQYLPYFYHTYVSKFVWGYTCGIFAEPKTQRKVVVLLVIINFKEILMSCQQRYTKYPADVGNEYCATWANNTSHVKPNATQGNIKIIW